MMLIATAAAFALVASTALAAAPAAATSSVPPMIVDISIASAAVPPALVKLVLAETDAIWRPAGITFVWRRAPRTATASADAGPFLPNTLHLVIGDERGNGREWRRPLGWIVFDALDVPQQEIYLSRANAETMMLEARGVVGTVAEMPAAQRNALMARAMGRALAHEIGHYLLASKAHAEHGLMKAILTAAELFMPDSRALRIEPAQRLAVIARLAGQPLVASR